MWYLKNLLNPRWIFDILKSGSNDFQSLIAKIKAWFWFDQQTLIIFGICFLFKCMAPSEGEGKCIGSYENGIDNVFTLKASDITSAGGGDIEDGIYKGTGQSMPWIDTGFETTGDQLIVYANGDYFPWGKAATEKTTTYHPITKKLGDTDQWVTALQLSEDYQECELNTDIKYTQYDAKSVKELYENHLNKYTTINPNNRDQGFAHRLAYDHSGIALPNVIQADCINHNNCEIDDTIDENPIGCVLRRGAGIYMKFGEDMPFSYHIINHDVPSLRKECDSTGSNCEYKYVKIGTNAIKTTRIPFALPMMFYRRDELDEDIRDTQEEVNGKLVTYKQYDKETNYRFTILEPKTGVCPTGDPTYQTIDSQCYKSVTKKLTKDEVQNYDCKKRDVNDEKHPDEFCPPPKGQRIYVKFADTFYEDDEGAVDLIFASGAKNLLPKFKYEINGFKLSWIQYIPYKLVAPFWGDQTKEDEPSELLEYRTYTDKIEIYNKNGDAIYPSTYRGTDFIKTTRFGDKGIRLCGAPIVDDKCSLPSQNLLLATAYKNTDGDISKVAFKPKNSTVSLSSINFDEVTPDIENWLIKIDRLNEGLFFKVRDAILINPLFTFAKIFFALWFVFSFGIGFLNKTKMITLPTYTKDWKHFLILMWATDPDNYALIDDLLWPALFRYAERFAAGILEIGTSIYGASLHYNNPYEFFDESIQMMTSKQLIYKISSLANDIIYWPVYLGWFPLLGTGIIRYIKTVVSWIWSLFLVLMDLGAVIMLLPFYAVISFFKSHEGTLKKTLIRILHTFTHLAFEMGFFCLLMGFVYKAFLEAIDIDICWRVKFEFKLFWIFPLIKLYAWVIDGINSVFAAYKEIFGGLLLGVLKFFLLSFITDWSSKIAKMAADALMPDNMARSIAAAEEEVGKPLGKIANSVFGTIGGALDTNKIGGSGDKMEDTGRLSEKPTKEALEELQENNTVPRGNEIPASPKNGVGSDNTPGQGQIGQQSGGNMQQPGVQHGAQSSNKAMQKQRQGVPIQMKNMDEIDGSKINGTQSMKENTPQAEKSLKRVKPDWMGGGGDENKLNKLKSGAGKSKNKSVFKQHDENKRAEAQEDVQKELKNKLTAQQQPNNATKGGIDNGRQRSTGNNLRPMENIKTTQNNERIRKVEKVDQINERDRQINVIQEDGGTRTIEKNTYIHESGVGQSGINVNNNGMQSQGNVVVNGKSYPIGTKVQVGNTTINVDTVVQQPNEVLANHLQRNKSQLIQNANVNEEMIQNINNQIKANDNRINGLQKHFDEYKSGNISEKQFSDNLDKMQNELLSERRIQIESMTERTMKENALKQLNYEEEMREINKEIKEGSISLDEANNRLSKMSEEVKLDNIRQRIGTMSEGDLKNELKQEVQRMEEKMDLSDKLSKGEISKEQYDDGISKIAAKEQEQFKEFVNNLPEGQNKETLRQTIENTEQLNAIEQDLKDGKITFEEAGDRMKQVEEKINSRMSELRENDQSQTSENAQQQISENNSNTESNSGINITINGQKYEVPATYDENGNYNFGSKITVNNDGVTVDGQQLQPISKNTETPNFVEQQQSDVQQPHEINYENNKIEQQETTTYNDNAQSNVEVTQTQTATEQSQASYEMNDNEATQLNPQTVETTQQQDNTMVSNIDTQVQEQQPPVSETQQSETTNIDKNEIFPENNVYNDTKNYYEEKMDRNVQQYATQPNEINYENNKTEQQETTTTYNDNAQSNVEVTQTQTDTEPSQALYETNDVSYAYDVTNNEITINNTAPEVQTINDATVETNASIDISYSSNSATETPIVEKLESKVENKDVAIQKEDAKQDKVQEMIEKYKSEDEEKRIKLNRNVENNAWAKKK